MTPIHSLIVVLIACLLLATASVQAADKAWGQWQNPLKPKGEPASGIALAVGGETGYVIVIPESPTTQEQKAAEALAEAMEEFRPY